MNPEPRTLNPNGAFSDELAARLTQQDEWWFDEPLADTLARLFEGCSVGDFGCGYGKYAAHLRRRGIHCLAFDATPYLVALPDRAILELDLTQPIQLPCPFDWALCLEVLEHIPAKFARIALENLLGNSRLGVVLSWAVPGQGGHGHVNEQPNSHAIDWFTAHACRHDPVTQAALRQAARIPWFKNTIMVFRAK